jgi:UbiD family decarboxylase
MPNTATAPARADLDKFRLRPFIERLIEAGEVEVHDEPVPLIGLGALLDGNPKAVLCRKAGPEKAEIVGNVLGARSRLALAFGVAGRELSKEVVRRLARPQPRVEVAQKDAPVQQVVLTGADADLTKLPAHLQHGFDGGPYISASIDYVIDPETGLTNAGSRRMMLRSAKEAGIDLIAPSDLRAIYQKSVARKERLPVSFTVGAHPIDFLAASMRVHGDELALVGTLRGEPVPVVKCRTNDIYVPADAEMVLEGYLDELGYREGEGPYGEFYGYYGVMKQNPVFHLTAITRRRDALFQTVTISGANLDRTETAQIGALRTEATVWRTLETAIREPVAVFASAASNGSNNVRVAMRQRVPGEARNAISSLFGSLANIKNVFVVDDDIDVFSDTQMDWALSTRFQADRDLVVESGFRAMPLDPSLDGRRTWSKAGFDLTLPFGARGRLDLTVPKAPQRSGPARFQSVRQALESGPKTFGELVNLMGSDDGREIVRALDGLRREGRLKRLEQGEYALQ